MSLRVQRTPCVGICSTTYGDLVCRGCRRFAHEIRDWNQYSEAQRERVWARLKEIHAGALLAAVEITDPALAGRPALEIAEVVGARLARGEQQGFRSRDGVDNAELRIRIEREAWLRSVAHYERAFRVSLRD